jgi:hypothetical protein
MFFARDVSLPSSGPSILPWMTITVRGSVAARSHIIFRISAARLGNLWKVTVGDGEIDGDVEELEVEIEDKRVAVTSCIELEEAMESGIVEDFNIELVELVEFMMMWVGLGLDVLARFVSWSRRELGLRTSVVKLLLAGSRLP